MPDNKKFNELDQVIRTVIGEADNQGRGGKEAVTHVIINRANAAKRWLKKNPTKTRHPLYGIGTLVSAATSYGVKNTKKGPVKIYQFSCWNRADKVYNRISTESLTSTAYIRAEDAVNAALESTEDLTLGATHYHTKSMNPYPSWTQKQANGKQAQKTVTIGDHIFYKNVP